MASNSLISIRIATVDGFQGSECDIIIVSCTRTQAEKSRKDKKNSIGFLKDARRLNVCLTRAKGKDLVCLSLWLFMFLFQEINSILVSSSRSSCFTYTESLWMVGDANLLRTDDTWNRLIQHMNRKNVLRCTNEWAEMVGKT